MTSLDHFGEPRPPHGGLVAEGALNLLGRPDMDALVVLVREAVQNSWDARQGRGQVSVEIEDRTLTSGQRYVLKNEVLRDLPPKGLFNGAAGDETELDQAVDSPELGMLSVTDRGTSGLGGPLRADQPAGEGEPTDFVDLVFNIGQPPDKELGGGTYGFGKTISYLVSQCRTVIIHTSAVYGSRIQQRLIVQSIGLQYSYGGRNFTGRHWWGSVSKDGIGPAVGARAGRLAEKLGLPRFEADECGTTIGILMPDFGGRTGSDATQYIAEALTWNFWPKMVGENRRPPAMRFAVRHQGRVVPVPAPHRVGPLAGFAQALEAVRDCETGAKKPEDFPNVYVFEVWSKRPKLQLGMLAMHPVAVAPQEHEPGGNSDEEAAPRHPEPFSGPPHHVALMRRAELVVDYRSGPALTSPAVGWCGVFRAAQRTDRAFAAAEPPTHDDWRPALVRNKQERSYVTVALREIRAFAEATFARPPGRRQVSEAATSAAVVAEALGGIIAPAGGSGASPPGREKPERAGPARPRIAKVGLLGRWLEAGPDSDALTLRVEFTVEAAVGTTATRIRAVAAAAGAEGTSTESEPPERAAVPTVSGFRRNGVLHEGDELEIPAGDSGPWTVEVRQPRGVATVVDVAPTSGGQS